MVRVSGNTCEEEESLTLATPLWNNFGLCLYTFHFTWFGFEQTIMAC